MYWVRKYQYFLGNCCLHFQGRWRLPGGYSKFVLSVHTYQQISILSYFNIFQSSHIQADLSNDHNCLEMASPPSIVGNVFVSFHFLNYSIRLRSVVGINSVYIKWRRFSWLLMQFGRISVVNRKEIPTTEASAHMPALKTMQPAEYRSRILGSHYTITGT